MRVVIIGFGLIKMVGLFYVTKVRRMGLVMIRWRTLPYELGIFNCGFAAKAHPDARL